MRTFLKFLALACLLLAIACLIIAAPYYRQQYRILRTWPAVEGTVANSAIVPYADSSGGSLYAAQLEFSYRVNDRDYAGVYEFPHLSTHYERKKKQLAPFPPGSRHPIRYNPADPTDIRIQAGYNVHFFVVPVFITGVGLIFVIVAAALYAISRFKHGPVDDDESTRL